MGGVCAELAMPPPPKSQPVFHSPLQRAGWALGWVVMDGWVTGRVVMEGMPHGLLPPPPAAPPSPEPSVGSSCPLPGTLRTAAASGPSRPGSAALLCPPVPAAVGGRLGVPVASQPRPVPDSRAAGMETRVGP